MNENTIQVNQIKKDLDAGKSVYITLDVTGKDNVLNKYPDYKAGKIRIELKEKEKQQLPDRTTDAALCETGVTGSDDLPKIGLSKGIGWNWNDISEDSCAQKNYSTGTDNASYIYCDATQFSISLLKRVEKVQQFVSDNSGILTCPINPLASNESQFFAQGINQESQPIIKEQDIASGNFGIKRVSIEAQLNGAQKKRTVRALIAVQNNSSIDAKLGIQVMLKNSDSSVYAPTNCINESWLADSDNPNVIPWIQAGWPANDLNALFKAKLFVAVPKVSADSQGLATVQCLFENVKENPTGAHYTLDISLKKNNKNSSLK